MFGGHGQHPVLGEQDRSHREIRFVHWEPGDQEVDVAAA